MTDPNTNPDLISGFCTSGTTEDIPNVLKVTGWTPENPNINGNQYNKIFNEIFGYLNFLKSKGLSFWQNNKAYYATANNIDIVRKNNKIYFAKQNSNTDPENNPLPKDPATNSDYWGVLIDLTEAETLQFLNGNLGLNALPKNWQGYKAYEVGILSLAGGASNFELGSNFYYDGTNFRYKSTGKATRIGSSLSYGSFAFYYAVDGQADAIINWIKAFEMGNTGITNFTKFPTTPNSSPLSNYEVANKKYVDDKVTVSITPTPEVITSGQNWNGVDIGGGEKLYPDGTICGQNANGFYTKFPNGDLICSMTKSSSSGWQTLTLPYTFVSADYKTSILMHTTDSSTYTVKYTSKTTTSFNWGIMLSNGSNVIANADIIVKGKWK